MLKWQVKVETAKASLREQMLDDTGSVIEELGFKGLMIAAALAAGGVVALAVAAWAGAIPTP